MALARPNPSSLDFAPELLGLAPRLEQEHITVMTNVLLVRTTCSCATEPRYHEQPDIEVSTRASNCGTSLTRALICITLTTLLQTTVTLYLHIRG